MLKYPTLFYSSMIYKSSGRGVVWEIYQDDIYYSKSLRRGVAWELYQDDITPNHRREGWHESYARMILLQIIGERGGVRAMPGWYYSKSSERGVAWELYQDDITPNHRERGGVRAIPGWYYSKSWGRGVAWELYQDDITRNHRGEGAWELYRMILLEIIGKKGGMRGIPG
jgi:hypothetical protein